MVISTELAVANVKQIHNACVSLDSRTTYQIFQLLDTVPACGYGNTREYFYATPIVDAFSVCPIPSAPHM